MPFHLNVRNEYGDFIVNLCYKCWLERQKVEKIKDEINSLSSLDDTKELLEVLKNRIEHLDGNS